MQEVITLIILLRTSCPTHAQAGQLQHRLRLTLYSIRVYLIIVIREIS